MNIRFIYTVILQTMFLTSFLLAQSKEPQYDGPFLETSQPGITLSGYVDVGYTYNYTSRNDAIQGRGLTADTANRGDFNVFAVVTTLEKALSEENELQAGFRLDMWLGEDAGDFNTLGPVSNSSAFWLQQAYAQFRVPIGNGLDIWMGRFGSFLGFEADERPANINITPGLNASIDPAKQNGVAFIYPTCDLTEIGFMIANTSDNSNDAGLDSDLDNVEFAAYLNLHNPSENAETQWGLHLAPTGTGVGGQTENELALIVNWWGNWMPVFAEEKLLLSYNFSFAHFDDFAVTQANAPVRDDSSTLWTLALYSQYQINEWLSIGGRGEYFHNDDNNLAGLTSPGLNAAQALRSVDLWGITGTLGFHIYEDMMIRLEHRADFGNDIINFTDAAINGSGPVHTTSLQLVYSY